MAVRQLHGGFLIFLLPISSMAKQKFDLTDHIQIDADSQTPKYEQIVDQFIDLYKKGLLYKGMRLPAINKAYQKLEISRDTLIAAYKELQNQNYLESIHGKGFYVTKTRSLKKMKVFLLFDVMNGYKEVLYRSIKEELGAAYEIDIYFHYYNLKLFERLIIENQEAYDYCVIMPHFNSDVSSIVGKIPINKLFIIDKDIPQLKEVPAVFQNFETDVLTSLNNHLDILKHYKAIYLLINRNFQFIPDGILTGFEKFCIDNNFNHGFIESIANHAIEKGEAYISFTDRDLVDIIKNAQQKGLKLGSDIGLISYDDTPLKEILAGGITVMTTNFAEMGKTAANMIKNNRRKKIANPFTLILRNSL